MAIEGISTTITKDAAAVGEVVSINLPDDEAKEFEVTSLDDTREQFKLSKMSVGQELPLTIRLNPETPQIVKGSDGVWVITLPKQTSGSAAGATYTFSGYVRIVTGGTVDVGSSEGITQDATIRLTTEVVVVDEV